MRVIALFVQHFMKQTNPTGYLQLNCFPPGFQRDNRAVRDGKVGCNTGKYTTLTVFLFF